MERVRQSIELYLEVGGLPAGELDFMGLLPSFAGATVNP